MDIVELTDEQWREFLRIKRPEERLKFMRHFLRRHYDSDVMEMWWIPLDHQSALKISKSAVVHSHASMELTEEERLRELLYLTEMSKESIERQKELLDERALEEDRRIEELKNDMRSRGYKVD